MKKNFYLIIVLTLSVFFVQANTQSVLWSENFEGDWTANWHADAGTWNAGIPTSGPGSAYQGQNCAATVLDGNYAEPVDSRLIRHVSFTVPSESSNPRLRFWHWYSFSTYDYGQVQIKVENGPWQSISTNYTNTSSGVWTFPSIDLSDYADSTVQIAFYFHSHRTYEWGSSGNVSTGWYIDEVEVVTGPIDFNNPEDWENGIGDWASERGTWEVGTPSSGPGSAYKGSQCVATVLNGSYAEPVDSRFISPEFIVPVSAENPRLRFWHWYSFSTYDYGQVQIKVGIGPWQSISTDYTNTSSGVWTFPSIDLSDYADSTVQIAFYFHSHRTYEWGSSGNVSTGWYIDEVEVETGPIDFNNPKDWENGIGDWASERGTWEVGTPSSGPGSAYKGTQCVATVLNGSYAEPVDSRLISPVYTVPPSTKNPALRFRHWYSFSTYDYGIVQIKTTYGEWTTISDKYINTSSGEWTYPYFDLSMYADSIIQIAFYFHSHRTYEWGSSGNVSTGWYIDDVVIQHDSQLSSENDIKTYSFGAPPQNGNATIDATNKTINIEVESGTTLTNLVATFLLSDGAIAKVGGEAQISGTTANNFTSPVIYTVTAEDGTTVQDWLVTVTIPTGIDEYSLRNINIYPNPFSDKTTIEFSNSFHSNYKLTVFSTSGNKVFEMDNVTTDKIVLKRGNLKTGIYIVELRGEKIFENKRIVIK